MGALVEVSPVKRGRYLSGCLAAKSLHEEITRQIQAALKKELPAFYVLSTGCTACETCACPEEPCRHPEEA